MAKYLLDTNILIDHARGKIDLTQSPYLADSYISFVNVAELIAGARNKLELKKIQQFTNSFEVDFANADVLVLSLKLFSQYHLTKSLEFFDSLMASTALLADAILVSSNTKHFVKIKNLKLMSEAEFVKNY